MGLSKWSVMMWLAWGLVLLVGLACVGMAAAFGFSVFVGYILPVLIFLGTFALIGVVVIVAVRLIWKMLF